MILGLRKATWLLIGWCAAVSAWAYDVAGGTACDGAAGPAAESACVAGAEATLALVLAVGAAGIALLGLFWGATRPLGRRCSRCGEPVTRGHAYCPPCTSRRAAAQAGVAPS